MCRFLGYLGSELFMAELLFRPGHSLIKQSYRAEERPEPLNGDGFGVGWYSPESNIDPCVFRSITPAWNNQNLGSLAEHVRSKCFFAHVRAASPGMAVAESNCHPFRIGRYLWMHNGTLQGFKSIRRKLCNSLPDDLYESIEGTTDSEHAFAVFLNILDDRSTVSTSGLANAMTETIGQIEEWVRETQPQGPSIYNFAVTDGSQMAAVRYISDPKQDPISLYYSKRGKFTCLGGRAEIVEDTIGGDGVILASERLTKNKDDWVRVAPNHILTISPDLMPKVELMPKI